MWPWAIMCTTASSKNEKIGPTRWEAMSVGMLGNWLLLALDWARANSPTDRISIRSDSQSRFKAIQSDAHDTQSIHQRLDNRECPTTLTWVPGDKDIPGNEAAEELVKQLPPPLTLHPDLSHLPPRKPSFNLADPPPNRTPTTMVYENFSWKADWIATSNRAGTVLLATHRSSNRTPTY